MKSDPDRIAVARNRITSVTSVVVGRLGVVVVVVGRRSRARPPAAPTPSGRAGCRETVLLDNIAHSLPKPFCGIQPQFFAASRTGLVAGKGGVGKNHVTAALAPPRPERVCRP